MTVARECGLGKEIAVSTALRDKCNHFIHRLPISGPFAAWGRRGRRRRRLADALCFGFVSCPTAVSPAWDSKRGPLFSMRVRLVLFFQVVCAHTGLVLFFGALMLASRQQRYRSILDAHSPGFVFLRSVPNPMLCSCVITERLTQRNTFQRRGSIFAWFAWSTCRETLFRWQRACGMSQNRERIEAFCVCFPLLFCLGARIVQVAARVEQEAGSTVLVNACCPGEKFFFSRTCLR